MPDNKKKTLHWKKNISLIKGDDSIDTDLEPAQLLDSFVLNVVKK